MELSISKILEHCKKLVSDFCYREEYLFGLRNKCAGITGYFSNYIPEEIIAAAGFHPLRIIGAFKSSTPYQRHLSNPLCSFVQDVFSAGCQGELSFLSSIIFPNSCDSLKVLSQIWESEVEKIPTYTLLHPVSAGHDSIRYFAQQVEMLADEMKKSSGVNFTEADLACTIGKYNLTRNLLRQIYDLRKCRNAFLCGGDTVALMTAGLIMDRDEYNQMLAHIVREGKNQLQQKGNPAKKIMIMGPLVDNIRLLEQIEMCGASIIDDDITNGWRYFDLDVPMQGHLYENLAERYLKSAPSPTRSTDPKVDSQLFQDRISGLNLDGVIYINQKFCEPHVHNYLAKVDSLRHMGIRILMLEVEHGRSGANERDLLRIESFLEML